MGEGMIMITIRLAREADAAEMLAIYEPYVRESAVTFECTVPALEDFRKRIRDISSAYPWLVCLSGETVIGYGYAHRHMQREAYQWNAELSVYIIRDHLRQGLGKTLVGALVEILRLQNVRTVVGGVTSANQNSEKLLDFLEFRKIGVFSSAGYKCGAWHDVAWFQKAIGAYDVDPQPFIPIREIAPDAVADVLRRHH